MSSLDFDLDTQMTALELEWRRAFEAGILARADFEALRSRGRSTDEARLKKAADQLHEAESVKALVMQKIDRLERRLELWQ